jgi:membrane protease YdiL (CAAX protease family)
MANKNKDKTDQLFEFVQGSYLERTSRPVYAIFFLLPFIIFYELGTIFINTDVLNQSQVRVVAFVWLRIFLKCLGFGSKLSWVAPPLAVIIILVSIQLVSRKQWRFLFFDIVPMAVECVLLAVPLIVLTLFLNSPVRGEREINRFDSTVTSIETEVAPVCSAVTAGSLSASAKGNGESLLADIVTGIGAGIYEELIFRLILISVLMILFQDILRLSQKRSIIFAVLISAAMFSAHHHIIFLNGQFAPTAPFNWTEFSFRTIAGVYFAALYAIRGFGITAGTHAFYDIIAVLINVRFFQQ